MTKAFALNFSLKALFFLVCLDNKKRLPKLVRQPRPFFIGKRAVTLTAQLSR